MSQITYYRLNPLIENKRWKFKYQFKDGGWFKMDMLFHPALANITYQTAYLNIPRGEWFTVVVDTGIPSPDICIIVLQNHNRPWRIPLPIKALAWILKQKPSFFDTLEEAEISSIEFGLI